MIRCLAAALSMLAVAACRADDPYEAYINTSRDFRPVRQDPEMLWKAWPSFVYMPWTFQWKIGYTAESAKWSLEQGYNGAFLDHGAGGAKLKWIEENKLPFYVDHLAGKGSLHIWDKLPKQSASAVHGTGVRVKPVNEQMKKALQETIRRNLREVKGSPMRAAYALDDEISWGHFVHPCMWCVTDDKVVYTAWLKEIYGANAPTRNAWVSYSEILPRLTKWSASEFDCSPLMDQLTFNDAYWNNFIGELVEFANSIDPATPVGFVGGQAPNVFGGYDYARLMRKVQFIESYNIGSSQAIIRSFNPGNAIPAVTTHFHKRSDDTIWQSWYYLAHGNRGFIGWVSGWFENDGTAKAWHKEVAPALLEVEKLSPLLNRATWQHDGVAIYYSHPSIQMSWILDAAAHGKTWTNRNDDDRLGSSHLVRKAWENMLRDSGFQYNFISYVDVIQKGIPAEYHTLILPACVCLSDAEARRLRAFVNRGGTLIADYLPGLWDQHGRGRPNGGAIDDLFGIKHDPAMKHKDVFGDADTLWVESDQEANFSYKTYEQYLTHKTSNLKDASGFNNAVRNTPVQTVKKTGKGTAVLMNLSPQWYNAYRAAGEQAAAKRDVFVRHIPAEPFARITGDGVFGADVTRWKRPDGRSVLFVTFNPEIEGTSVGGGNSVGLKSTEVNVTLTFARELKNMRNERTGHPITSAKQITLPWKQNEAIVLSFD